MRLFLLFALVLVAGCAGSRPGADLPPQYAAAPPAIPTTDQLGYDTVSTGDGALDSFLLSVAAAFERHDWRRLAYTLDPDGYAEQFAFMRGDGRPSGAAASQVLEETFGLGTAGNTVFPAGLLRADRPFAGLDRVRRVSLTAIRPSGVGEFRTVEGRVTLDDRTSRALSFQITDFGGGYRVVVPMG
jgi:hypothetical protein